MWHRATLKLGMVVIFSMLVFAPAAFAQDRPADAPEVKVTHYKDWDVRCPKNKDAGGCEMTQLVNSPDTGKPLLRLVMGYPPEIDTAAMIFILPLGTRLAPGVQLSVDGGKKHAIAFQVCLKQGCRADFPLSDALRGKMRAGHNATLSLIGPSGEQIDLKISLQGFTAADNRIAN